MHSLHLAGLTGAQENTHEIHHVSGPDPATGLYTQASIDQRLGKEIARARRQNTALTVAIFHLEDFAQLNARCGRAATEEMLKEFARRLKQASRGSDYAVRLRSDDFLLVLPKCNLSEAKLVVDRLGSLEVSCTGQKTVLAYTTGWADYQPGDLPADLLNRAGQILQLYKKASKDILSPTALIPTNNSI